MTSRSTRCGSPLSFRIQGPSQKPRTCTRSVLFFQTACHLEHHKLSDLMLLFSVCSMVPLAPDITQMRLQHMPIQDERCGNSRGTAFKGTGWPP